MCRILLSIFTSVFLLSFAAFAADPHEHIFTPKVTIVKNANSDALEIIAPKRDFVTKYTNTTNAFSSLVIPFAVQSKTQSNIDYALALGISQHFCQFQGRPLAKNLTSADSSGQMEMENVALFLDDKPFSFSNKLPLYHDVYRQDHLLKVVFPKMAQLDEALICSGRVSIIAEMAVL